MARFKFGEDLITTDNDKVIRRDKVAPTPEPTAGDAFRGLTPTETEADIFARGRANEAKLASEAVLDEDAIRNKTTSQFQSEIDALNKVFAQKKEEARVAGLGRLGETGAIQARRGLLGSDFGAAQTQGTRDINLDIQKGIEAQRALKESAIFNDIRVKSDAAFKEEQAAKEAGGTAYLAFLRGEDVRKSNSVSTTVQNILSNDVEPSDQMYAQIAEQLGVSEEVLRAEYNNQLTTAQSAQSAAASAAAQKQADLAFKQAQTSDLLVKPELQTQEEEAKALLQAQKDEASAFLQEQKAAATTDLERLKLEGDLAKIRESKTKTDLEIISEKLEIEKLQKENELIGVTDPKKAEKNQLEIDKLRQELGKKENEENKARIAAGQEVEVLQTKIDDINEIIGLKEGMSKSEIASANEAIENLVGTTGLGRTALLSRYTEKNRKLVGFIGQLTAQDTLDTLKNLKKSGATLGAISEKELDILQSAANQLNKWEVKKDGVGQGRWNTSESLFKAELKKIAGSAKRLQDAARKDAEGSTSDVGGVDNTEDLF